jgi:hypothetical protein
MCYWTKRAAEGYLRRFKRRYPTEPAFVVPTRKLRQF